MVYDTLVAGVGLAGLARATTLAEKGGGHSH